MELFQASSQWMTRPNDERFWDLQEMHQACNAYRQTAATTTYPLNELTVAPHKFDTAEVMAAPVEADSMRQVSKLEQSHKTVEPDILLANPTKNGHLPLTAYAFEQLSKRVGAPAGYLRKLPAEMACENLNYGLANHAGDSEGVIMHHRSNGDEGRRVARCITSGIYARIWNAEVVDWCMGLPSGWRNIQAAAIQGCRTRIASESDCLRNSQLGIRPGEKISPSGLYASDRDYFVFLINDDKAVEFRGHTLYRGMMISGSEVGDRLQRMTLFLFEDICRNHIIWGADGVVEFKIRHVGDQAYEKFSEGKTRILTAADQGTHDDMQKLTRAFTFEIGKDQDKTLEAVLKATSLTKGQAQKAWVKSIEHEDEHGCAPNTAWGYASGITRLSQESKHQNDRENLDREAARVINMANF